MLTQMTIFKTNLSSDAALEQHIACLERRKALVSLITHIFSHNRGSSA